MRYIIERWTWGSDIPELIEADWDDQIAELCEMDDDSTWFATLGGEWAGLPKGTLIVGQNTVEGHAFCVVTVNK